MTLPEAPHKRTSDILETLIADSKGQGDISIGEIMQLLGERAFGLSILVFSLPNSLPIPSPPGFSAITGVPIVLLALQMMFGRSMPWLPKRVANYSFSRDTFGIFLGKALPYIRKIERLLHPRLKFMHSKTGERFIGIIFLGLSIVLSLPIPFGNFLPGLSISLIALGLLERDGALILGGTVLGVVGTSLVFAALGAAALAAFHAVIGYF